MTEDEAWALLREAKDYRQFSEDANWPQARSVRDAIKVVIDARPATEAWVADGDAIVKAVEAKGGLLFTAAFHLGHWWADRPWRRYQQEKQK